MGIFSCFKISLIGVSGEIFGGVVIRSKDVEVVAIDLDVSTDWELGWSDELHTLVDVLILLSGKEWSLDDTRILLSWLEDRDGVISQVEGDDESSIHVFWHLSVESGSESQDLLIVVDVLEEINLGLLWNKIIHIAEGIDFVSETVVWWDLHNDGISGLHWLNVAHWEVSVVSGKEVVLGELVYSLDLEASTIGYQVSLAVDLVASQISVSNELLTWLIDVEHLRQLLSSKVHGEGISSVIWEVDLSDLHGIVSKEVVPHELEVFRQGEESEHLSVIVEELLLGSNSSSS